MATVYKSTTYKAVDTRAIQTADAAKSNAISSTLTTFFNYFKTKHLS